MPVIGMATVEAMIRAGASCLSVEAGRTLLFDREALLKRAAEAGIAIVATPRVAILYERPGFRRSLCVLISGTLFPIQRHAGGSPVKIPILFVLAAAVVVAVAIVAVRASVQKMTTMPTVGQVAPTFTLPSQDGTQISLDSFRGKWVVLYFYPKDMTPGCTIEAHNFQRDQAQFDAANAVILGVSVDTPDSHKQFCTKEGLTFRLLADPEHKVVDAYGSLGNFGPFTIANRNTFLIDPGRARSPRCGPRWSPAPLRRGAGGAGMNSKEVSGPTHKQRQSW